MISSFVVIDFETLFMSRHSIYSVGLVKFIDNKEVDSYYTLIQPKWDALEMYENCHTFEYIHGIKMSQLIDKPTFIEVLPIIEKFVGDFQLVAHNASFEKGCLKSVCELYNVETVLDYENMLDTLKITREVEKRLGLKINGKGTHTLNTLCKMYGVESGTHHNALDDSVDCGNMLIKMNEILSLSNEEIKNYKITVPEPIIEIYTVPETVSVLEIINS